MKVLTAMKFSVNLLLCLAAVAAVLLRFVPAPLHNFSAMGALAVLCGVHARTPLQALALPLAARLITDVLLQIQSGYGFYSTMLFDYAAYALIVVAGRCLRPSGLLQGTAAGLLSAVTFFFISNFGVWCLPFNGQYLYPQTLQGLQQCLTMGLPFARGTLISDLLLTPIFLAAAAALLAPSTQPAPGVTETLK